MPKPRLRSALNTDIDPRLLERAQEQAKRDGVGLRFLVERALSLYLDGDGLPAAIRSSFAQTQADLALIAGQMEPIGAFLATLRYGDSLSSRRRAVASQDDDL